MFNVNTAFPFQHVRDYFISLVLLRGESEEVLDDDLLQTLSSPMTLF